MISLNELQARLEKSFSNLDPNDQTSVAKALQEHCRFGLENYNDMDSDAKSAIDRSVNVLEKLLREMANALPDGPQKRQMSRGLATAAGTHHSAKQLLILLESASQLESQVLQEGHTIMVRLIQNILDILFDMTRHTHKGIGVFANVGLVYWSVDELLVATHLAKRAFTNQAYTHLRTVWEILDKIELFHIRPEWAKLWVTGDERKVWNELRPGEVRKKLGKPRYDPIYSDFSELGPHGTFKGLQARASQEPSEKENTLLFRLWVGGCPQEHHVVGLMTDCVLTANITLLKCAQICGEHLNIEEANKIVKDASDAVVHFIREHFAPWAQRNNQDPSAILALFEGEPWKNG